MDIGKILRDAREARGLTLEQVEEETKIRRKYLEALEKEAFDVLPGRVYVRGFLRNYARFLELDERALLARLEDVLPPEAATVPETPPVQEKDHRPGGSYRRIAYGLAGLALAFILIWGAGRVAGIIRGSEPGGNPGGSPPAQVSGDPATVSREPAAGGQGQPGAAAGIGGEVSSAPSTPSPSGVNLVLSVTDETCWMRVVVDGQDKFTGELAANQSRTFQARQRIWVKLGNAGVVNVQVNGQNLGVLGGRGQVVNREFSVTTQG